MDFEIDSGWELYPVGGDTGQAYMGKRAEEKLFLKRNSSPFLAALSVEGVTPRLIWTKRIENGDVLTAQEWLNGRTLNKTEMSSPDVAKLLGRIHRSEPLSRMLARVGGEKKLPEQMLTSYECDIPYDLKIHPLLNKIVKELKKKLHVVRHAEPRVCHGDIYRKNWLLSDENRLYLVDWDSATLCDPAMDLSMLLVQYVKREHWESWLKEYGVRTVDGLFDRIIWYALLNFLMQIKDYHRETRLHEMNQTILKLQTFCDETKLQLDQSDHLNVTD